MSLEQELLKQRLGRIQSLRGKGKAGFMHLSQNGAKLHVYIKVDALQERDFKLYQLLDVGDIIGVEGYLFRMRTGELSVHADRLEFLSKTLLSIPEKWHALEDVEVRQTFITRSKVIASLRRQLEEKGFIEVETPMMQPLYGGAAARPFVTHHNTLDVDLYLRIAPELYLKRLVVGGLDRVYEVNRNFRIEGVSIRHNPEFTMLEFYQAYTDYRGLMDFSAELLRQTAIDATGSAVVEYQDQKIDFSTIRRYSMREAVIEFWQGEEKPAMEQEADPAWLALHSRKETAGERLLDIFERVAEGQLFQPAIIYDYPVETSPLSKNKPGDPAFVERFEIYAAGMEIGNAYIDLNDPPEQRRRFEMQIAMKEKGDEDYVRALWTNSRSIRDVILFPLLRPEGKIDLVDGLRQAE